MICFHLLSMRILEAFFGIHLGHTFCLKGDGDDSFTLKDLCIIVASSLQITRYYTTTTLDRSEFGTLDNYLDSFTSITVNFLPYLTYDNPHHIVIEYSAEDDYCDRTYTPFIFTPENQKLSLSHLCKIGIGFYVSDNSGKDQGISLERYTSLATLAQRLYSEGRTKGTDLCFGGNCCT